MVCKRAYLNTLGCLLIDSSLLDDLDKSLDREDFNTEKFYELLYIAIYNLHAQGCTKIDEFAIDTYLSAYPEQYKIFQDNKGLEYLVSAKEMASIENYDYYYHRLKKYTILRYFENNGCDTRFIFNNTLVDTQAMEREQAKFDEYTEDDIINIMESKYVITPRMKYCHSTLTSACQAGDNMRELINELMKTPDIGIPLKSPALNTVTRGGRKGCIYMRSSISGGGKSRMAAGDACHFAVPYYFDYEKQEWVYTGISEPTLYITTEMTEDEIKTILIASVACVNEDHILYGEYEEGEYERVIEATEYIESSPLHIIHIPDFSIEDIKNIVKQYNREFGVENFFFDYIHTSLRLMSEVSGKSGTGLKEHQLLLVFITEMKKICQQLNVFMLTASQLNGEAVNAPTKDQNLLSGSKALANKLDAGFISLPPTKTELKKVESILHKTVGMPVPNMCTWIYKVRRGRITRVVIWSFYDLGTMRVKDLFVTNVNFELIDMDFTKIEHVEEVIKENSVRMKDVEEVETIEETTLNNKYNINF